MKISKIIFFTETKFNRRDYQRFGIEYLIKHNINTEVWEFTPYLNPCLNNQYTPPDSFSFIGHKIITNKADYNKKIKSLTGREIVICLLGFSFKLRTIYYHLSKKKIFYGVECMNALPIPEIYNSSRLLIWEKILILIRKFFNPEKLKNQLILHFPTILFGIKASDFILVAGTKSLQDNRYPISKRTTIIQTHKLDYDLFLQMQEKIETPILEDAYALFLDEFGPFHPDYIFANTKPDCGPAEIYYPNLIRFFKYVEFNLGIPVVIAAHPRSEYERMPDYFEGRKIIRGHTIDLVKHAKLILAQASTSLNFAILFNKPIIILIQESFATAYKSYVRMFANLFGSPLIELSSDFPLNLNDLLKINYNKYLEYKEQWIKSPQSPDKLSVEILLDYVKSISK